MCQNDSATRYAWRMVDIADQTRAVRGEQRYVLDADGHCL